MADEDFCEVYDNEEKEDVVGDESCDVYDDECRDELVENDEVDEFEAGFVEGYEHEGGVCDNCKQVLVDDESIVEEEIDGVIKKFCCSECAEEYKSRLTKPKE